LSAFTDASSVPSGTIFNTDVLIVGGGPAGITLALALAHKPIKMLMLESGGLNFEPATQALYAGAQDGTSYLKLENSRLRYLGGSTNHWGGWCRPLDEIDFEARDWLPHSGWPITRKTLEPYFPRAQAIVEAGAFVYDGADKLAASEGAQVNLGKGGVYTTWFQFSKQRDNVLPTHFGDRYADDLKRIPNLHVMTHANVTGVRLASNAASVNHVDVATLSGKRFSVKPKIVVLAAGAIENARLLLASDDVMKTGIGNGNDLVGRFFADHPIPGDTATLVLFDGNIAPYYLGPRVYSPGIFRAAFAPTDAYKREKHVLGSLITVDGEAKLDPLGDAAVALTASALDIVDSANARAFTLGCGLEPMPDPDRRLTLTGERDALGMPRLKLHMRIADSDFARYRTTLKELGRQLLSSGAGMINLHHKTREEWFSVMDWGNHHMGTTRMSDDPKTGVVDANSAVHGVANLYVAGSSVFPTYGASNPTMNFVALTLRLADHLKKVIR
jgi:choline dehydrogenase-like flavoprotein